MAAADSSSPRGPRASLGSTPEARLEARPALVGGLAFMEAARTESLDTAVLTRWFDQHVVAPGWMTRPTMVQESGLGAALLTPTGGGVTTESAARVLNIVGAARARVIASLAGLIARPADDRFLAAAIFTARVERVLGAGGARWRPRPQPADRLSGIVLSLFAADALAHRDEYDGGLHVCEVCGRVALKPRAEMAMSARGSGRELRRLRCSEHPG